VGYGTFKPVKVQNIKDHKMMSERFLIDENNCEKINRAIKDRKRIAAVGTTAVRAIESAAIKTGKTKDGKIFLSAIEDETDIFIRPGHQFQIVDRLITNLHFPKSTPLIMTCAFASRELILRAYREAVSEKYRFFSYGDGMLIL
jgi:S-adenosylmethionine:tRNA ribosyltransferase-isomerase